MFGNGIVSSAVVGVVRRLVSNWFGQITPSQVITAIQNDESLWETYSGTILGYVDSCPPNLMQLARERSPEFIGTIIQNHGSLGNAVLVWLGDNHPMYQSLIINTPGGRDWLNRQANDMLRGLGIYDTA
jgi:hypothetical protein